MRAGKLQHPIQIERMTETVAPTGHVTKSWAPILSTRAEIKEVTTTEFLTQGIEGDKARAVFLIRWPAQAVTTADRIVHAGRVWNIVAVSEIGRRRGLELRAEATA